MDHSEDPVAPGPVRDSQDFGCIDPVSGLAVNLVSPQFQRTGPRGSDGTRSSPAL